jgi:hypothetical protein
MLYIATSARTIRRIEGLEQWLALISSIPHRRDAGVQIADSLRLGQANARGGRA